MRFIARIKGLINEAKYALERWRSGDTGWRYPIGMFPPRFPRLANPIRGGLAID